MEPEMVVEIVRDGLAYIIDFMDPAPITPVEYGSEEWRRLESAYGVLFSRAFDVSNDSFELFGSLVTTCPDEWLCTLGEGIIQTWINANIDDLATWVTERAQADPKWRQVLACVTLYEDTIKNESAQMLRGYVYGF